MKAFEITITEDEILQHMKQFNVSKERAIEELNMKETQEYQIQEAYDDLVRSCR